MSRVRVSRRRFLAILATSLAGAALAYYTLGPLINAGLFRMTGSNKEGIQKLVPPTVRFRDVRSIRATWRGYVVDGLVNPTLLYRRGDEINVDLINDLDEETIVHWHGFQVDWRNDGHPSYAVGPGGRYSYSFSVRNRPAMYAYHPHPHGRTARQFYMGMAGLIIVEDEVPLGFTYGVNDIPLIISDKRIIDGRIVYDPSPMEMVMGFLGNTVLVNGVSNPRIRIPQGTYRFRLMNASNARLYNLALVKGNSVVPLKLIAVDQGQLAKPVEVKSIFLGVLERAEVVVDLKPGVYQLKNLPFDPMHREHMNHVHTQGSESLDEGVEYSIATLEVDTESSEFIEVPEELPDPPPEPPNDVDGHRRFFLQLSDMQWTINGMFWDMSNPLRPHVSVNSGSNEVWEITNDEYSMPHPMHLHGFPMWVLERRNSPAQVAERAVDDKGRLPTDLGLKDTVLVWPGETVVVAIAFRRFEEPQFFPFHCHNLEHEDGGMMINVKVEV